MGTTFHFERMRRAQQGKVAGTIDESAVEAMRATELGLCDRCDVILYPSKVEADLMAALVAKGVQSRAIVAYSFSNEEIRGSAAGCALRFLHWAEGVAKLLFVGGFSHGPNVDGIVLVLPRDRSAPAQGRLSLRGEYSRI